MNVSLSIVVKSSEFRDACSGGTVSYREMTDIETDNIHDCKEWLLQALNNSINYRDYMMFIKGQGTCSHCTYGFDVNKVYEFRMSEGGLMINRLHSIELLYLKHNCKVYVKEEIEKERKSLEEKLNEIRESENKIRSFRGLLELLRDD